MGRVRLLDLREAIPSLEAAARIALVLAALFVAIGRATRRGAWLTVPLSLAWLAVVLSEFGFDPLRTNVVAAMRLVGSALAPLVGATVGFFWRRRFEAETAAPTPG